jgi:hypothetical protein
MTFIGDTSITRNILRGYAKRILFSNPTQRGLHQVTDILNAIKKPSTPEIMFSEVKELANTIKERQSESLEFCKISAESKL